MRIRDRVKELRRVRAGELLPNPKNWRVHPDVQKNALRGLLAEVGYADALLAIEQPGGLMLLDGHLRAETTPDEVVPVLVLDLSLAEADKVLATLDPLAGMAQSNAAALDVLLRDVETGCQEVADLLTSLAEEARVIPSGAIAGGDPINPADEWVGMPEFEHEDLTSKYKVIVHLRSDEDLADFESLIGQKVPRNRWAVWHPEAEITRFSDKRYTAGEGKLEPSSANIPDLHYLERPLGEPQDEQLA